MKNAIIQLFSVFIMFTVVQNIPAQLPLSEIEPAPDGLYNGRLSNQDFFKQADVIFQGSIISNNAVTNEDTSHVWSSVILDVQHVLKGKGKIKKEKIELILNNGVLYETDTILGDYVYSYPITAVGHGGYKLSNSGIFFCNLSDKTFRKQENNPSLIPLRDSEYSGMIIDREKLEDRGYEVYGLNDLYFKSIKDFYEYAAQYEGISVPEFIKKNIQKINSYEKLEDFMDYQRITGDDPAFFEFDVAIESSQATYYANSIGRLDFNTSVFGTNLVSNGKIELILNSDEFSPTNYTTNAYDVNA